MNLTKIDRIETPDGSLEVSIDMPSGDGPFPTVIVVHGWRGNATKGERDAELSEGLIAKGFATVRLNLPGHGRTSGSLQLFTTKQGAGAIVELAHWLSEQDIVRPDEISLVGTSIGGTCAILAATQFPLKALVLLSPRSDFTGVRDDMYRVSREENAEINTAILASGQATDFYALASKINAPTLIVHGEIDKDIPVEQSHQLFDSIGTKDKRLITITDAGHVFSGDNKARSVEQTIHWLTTPR